MNQNQAKFKSKIKHLVETCQVEIKKTAGIGKRMVNAGKTSGELSEAYQELGQLVIRELEAGRLEWDHADIPRLKEKVKRCLEDLDLIEDEVAKIKWQAKETDESKEPVDS